MRLRTTLLVLLGMLFLAGPALAQTGGITIKNIADNFGKLTEEQKAAIAATIATQASENNVSPVSTITPPNVKADDVEPWLSLIDKVGQGLVRLAKDLGVTANEVLRTPVGVITVGLMVYHVMGEEILEIFNAMTWAIVVFPLLVVFFFKSVIPVLKYEEITVKNWFGTDRTVRKPIRRRPVFGADEDFNADWMFVCLALIAGLVFVCLLP